MMPKAGAFELNLILLGGNQMAGNFKTCGEAWRYCEKYGLNNISAVNSFSIAEALLRAYKDGAIQPAVALEDAILTNKCSGQETLNRLWHCAECGTGYFEKADAVDCCR